MIERVGPYESIDASLVVDAYTAGIREAAQEPYFRHIEWQMQEAGAYIRAFRAQEHADWYCSLPWYRMLWALVTGR